MQWLFVALMFFALPAMLYSQNIRPAAAPVLFKILETPTTKSAGERSSVASNREAEIAFDRAASVLASSEAIAIELFDGKTFRALRRELETRALDDLTWRGKIAAYDVVLTFYKGHVAGIVFSPAGVFEIVPRGSKHFLVELDPAAFPECGGERAGDASAGSNAAPSATIDSGDRIDVIVVYTTATKNFLGGDTQAQAHAQSAIDAANTAYINSKIRQRVRMVNSQEFVYTESGNASTDLSNLRNNAGIATLRNTFNADLVAEISEVTSVCGIGYLMGGTGGNQNNAFTVTARSCAVGNLSLAHELGHNMGSQHNPENGSGATYPYGYGHYVDGSYRTVMSYVNPCPSGCPRVAYFSNPSVIYNGAPTGINNARDNARSINNTADTIAAYRYSGSSITLGSFNGGEWLPRLIARNVSWSSANITGNVRIEVSRDEGTNWETIVASTPNDGSESRMLTGRATRRARLRVVSLNSPTVSDSSVANITIR